jgi:hypothetical protein
MHLNMDIRYFRKVRSTFYKSGDRGRRPSAIEATVSIAQEEWHELEDVPLQIRRLAAVGVTPIFRAATAKLVIPALFQPVIRLRPGGSAEDAVLFSWPSVENL